MDQLCSYFLKKRKRRGSKRNKTCIGRLQEDFKTTPGRIQDNFRILRMFSASKIFFINFRAIKLSKSIWLRASLYPWYFFPIISLSLVPCHTLHQPIICANQQSCKTIILSFCHDPPRMEVQCKASLKFKIMDIESFFPFI